MEAIEPKKPEKLKTFNSFGAEELHKIYNNWMQENNEKIDVIKRQFRVGGARLYVALFYREK